MVRGDKGDAVKLVQTQLQRLGYKVSPDGDLGPGTENALKAFCERQRLSWTGEAGSGLLQAAQAQSAADGVTFTDVFLSADEYYRSESAKDTIYLHHTAGSSSAPDVVSFWEHDGKPAAPALKVATAFIIGGPSAKNAASDGQIVRAFDDKYWAHHLGTKLGGNTALNVKSVAIEVCNWGPLTKSRDGKFLTYVGTQILPQNVCELDKPFRGYKYYHKYSAVQIETLRKLINYLMVKNNIHPQKNFVWTPESFESSKRAAQGEPGIWTHTHVRLDKTDMFPQPELMDMLNALPR